MLSWDDFRIVKAIADRGSLAGAAEVLAIDQSTVFRKLGQIEQRLGARLFKRTRPRYATTERGAQMVQLAERMQSEVAAFERGLGNAAAGNGDFGVVPPDVIAVRSGLDFLTDMISGRLPQAPMCATLGFRLAEAEQGFAAFEGVPEFRHYNPIGTVHGGFAATLLELGAGLRDLLDHGARRSLDHAGAEAQPGAADHQGHRPGAGRGPHHSSRPYGRDL